VNTPVIDASIAVKWVVEEDGTPEALALLPLVSVTAPRFMVATANYETNPNWLGRPF
jgi:predicted nucleic acid-binding protein